jgi:hypothetical protein
MPYPEAIAYEVASLQRGRGHPRGQQLGFHCFGNSETNDKNHEAGGGQRKHSECLSKQRSES